VTMYCVSPQLIRLTPFWPSGSTLCITSQDGYGTAEFRSQKLVRPVITHIQCRARPFLNFIASTPRRFSSTLMRSAFSFHPVLIASWLCEKDQTLDARLWEC